MKIEPIHHIPLQSEYNSPCSAAYSIDDGQADHVLWMRVDSDLPRASPRPRLGS